MWNPAWNNAVGAIEALTVLYGQDAVASLIQPAGIVHVTAVWQEPEGRDDEDYVTLRIKDSSPKSVWDLFALDAARARADAIVVTGKILRDEPDLVYDLGGPGQAASALAAWRREVLGKNEPPFLLILTSGADLPASGSLDAFHPALSSWALPIVYTTTARARTLAAAARGSRTRVVGADRLDLASAITYLGEELGCQTISIEAGPSTSRALYHEPATPGRSGRKERRSVPTVDELLLSVFAGPRLAESVRGGPFLSRDRLAAIFPRTSPGRVIDEPSGPWHFYRMTRA